MKEYLIRKSAWILAFICFFTCFSSPVCPVFAKEGVNDGDVTVSASDAERSDHEKKDPAPGERGDDDISGNEAASRKKEDTDETEDEGGYSPGGESGEDSGDTSVSCEGVTIGAPFPETVSDDMMMTVVSEDGLSVVPAAFSDEEQAVSGGSAAPYISKVVVSLYSLDNPDNVCALYEYPDVKQYRYSAMSDKTIPFSDKTKMTLYEIRETVSCMSMVFYPNSNNTNFVLDELDRQTGEVISSTGILRQASFTFNRYSLYRLHVYALYSLVDPTDNEAIYYFFTGGIDKTPPDISSAVFVPQGNSVKDKNGKDRYGNGKIVIEASDRHTGLDPKPYMADYPNGEWVNSNVIQKPASGFITVAVRDKTQNITTTTVDTSAIDIEGPVLKAWHTESDNTANGYCLSETVCIEAEDETGLAEKYFSVDKAQWGSQSRIPVDRNGKYTFYLKDIFGNISCKEAEVTNIDKEAPQVSYVVTPDKNVKGYASSDVLRINAADGKAGLHERAFSFDGKKTWVVENRIEVKENGTYEICARDALGNESGVTSVEITNIDKKQPVITNVSENRQNRAGKYAQYTELTVTGEDDESGMDRDFISFDDGKTWTYDNKRIIRENGTHFFKIRDGVGNEKIGSAVIKDLDNDPPECTVSGNPSTPTKTKALLKVNINDELSGVESVYVENSKAGIKKLIGHYDPDPSGLGKKSDTLEVEVTSNGEYVFTFSDMCKNSASLKVTVNRLVKPGEEKKTDNASTTPEEPEKKKNEKTGGEEKDEIKKDDEKKTVVIGKSSTSPSSKTEKESTITVKSAARSENSVPESIKITASSNSSDGNSKDKETLISGKGVISENESIPEYESEDYSSEFYETDLEEHYSSNEPKELEALKNPDEEEVTEERSHAGVIAGTVFAIVIALSAFTVFLLMKKGIIKKPDFLGGSEE